MRLRSLRSTGLTLAACVAALAGPAAASALAAEPPGFVVSGDSLTRFDSADNAPGTTTPVGTAAQAVAIAPDGDTAYVTTGNTVRVVNTANNTAGATINLTG